MVDGRFAEMVKVEVEGIVAKKMPGAVVELYDIEKSTRNILKSICIREEELKVFPNIYLEEYEKEYEAGKSVTDIAKSIVATYEMSRMPELYETVTIKSIMEENFAGFKDKIMPVLVSAENAKYLRTGLVSRQFLDMTIIYKAQVIAGDEGFAEVAITHDILEKVGVGEDELHRVAMENLVRAEKYAVPISKFIGDSMGVDGMFVEPEDQQMLVATTKTKHNGAAVIMCNDLFKEIAEKRGMRKMHILPSSVHELMILPYYDPNDIGKLKDLVKEVNDTQVPEDEILSGNVYEYDLETNSVRISEVA